jgi:hypothetical protein
MNSKSSQEKSADTAEDGLLDDLESLLEEEASNSTTKRSTTKS